MVLLSGGPTFGGIFISEIWWAYYPVGLLSGGPTYGILRYIYYGSFIRKIKGIMIGVLCNRANVQALSQKPEVPSFSLRINATRRK